MNPVPDRKRLRREYLRKKGIGYAHATFYGALAAPCAFAVMLLLITTWTYLPRARPIGLIVLACLIGLAGLCICWLGRSARQARQKARRVPYVPPVTPSTLPTEEILVRGAAEPSAQGATLLRAGVKDEETKGEELLRSSTSR
jgi:hypothetical protein